MKVKFKKLRDGVKLPERKKQGDAGYDIYLPKMSFIANQETKVIPLGFAMEIDNGHYAQLEDRSSMAANGFFVVGGVIDSGYRGEVSVCIHNSNNYGRTFNVNDRVAQIIFHDCHYPEIEEVDDLSESDRGICGFGSTGK